MAGSHSFLLVGSAARVDHAHYVYDFLGRYAAHGIAGGPGRCQRRQIYTVRSYNLDTMGNSHSLRCYQEPGAAEGCDRQDDQSSAFAVIHPLTPKDEKVIETMRALTRSAKGMQWGVEGRGQILLDDSRRYVQRAVAAGIDAQGDVWLGMPHGFHGSVGTLTASALVLEGIGKFLTD